MEMKIKNIKDFYTIDEFAQKLDVHPNTVRRSIKNGKLCAFKFGTNKKASYRIPHSEIDRIMMFDLKNLVIKLIEEEKST